MHIIKWAALGHCPSDQLYKKRPTDAGFDVRIAETVLVPPYSESPFVWEDLDSQDTAAAHLPNLFSYAGQSIFQMEAGLRVVPKYVIEYAEGEAASLIEQLKKLGCRSLNECPPNFLRIDTRVAKENITSLPGVLSLCEVNFLQRKRYKPLRITTGIKISPQDLSWCVLALRSSAGNYAITQPHGLGVIDFSYDGELLIQITSLHQYSVFMRGERLAQLIPLDQREITLQQVAVEELRVTHRGGFGSTGTGLLAA